MAQCRNSHSIILVLQYCILNRSAEVLIESVHYLVTLLHHCFLVKRILLKSLKLLHYGILLCHDTTPQRGEFGVKLTAFGRHALVHVHFNCSGLYNEFGDVIGTHASVNVFFESYTAIVCLVGISLKLEFSGCNLC